MKGFKIAAVCLLLFALSYARFAPAAFAMDKDEVGRYIGQAESDLASAYTAVAKAELAGANISVLKERLNNAAGLLANASNAFKTGDYDGAYLFATQCNETLKGVVGNATSLQVRAESAYGERLLWAASGSSLGLSVLFVLSLFGWRFLKKRYLRWVLELKPEAGGKPK